MDPKLYYPKFCASFVMLFFVIIDSVLLINKFLNICNIIVLVNNYYDHFTPNY